MLVSHHGQYEFGSPKLPMFREALLLHYLDDLDSKMAAMRSALDSDDGEGNWTAFSGALERRLLRSDRFLAASGKTTEKTSAAQAAAGGGETSDGHE
jgi:3'-5' exoribonuclease